MSLLTSIFLTAPTLIYPYWMRSTNVLIYMRDLKIHLIKFGNSCPLTLTKSTPVPGWITESLTTVQSRIQTMVIMTLLISCAIQHLIISDHVGVTPSSAPGCHELSAVRASRSNLVCVLNLWPTIINFIIFSCCIIISMRLILNEWCNSGTAGERAPGFCMWHL